MKSINYKSFSPLFTLFFLLLFNVYNTEAQRMGRGGGGGRASAGMTRQTGGGASAFNRQSINGGSRKSLNGGINNSSAGNSSMIGSRAGDQTERPSINDMSDGKNKGLYNDKISGSKLDVSANDRTKPSKGSGARNRATPGTIDRTKNNVSGGRGNGNTNINTNINIQNNYYGRPNTIPYYRPPYAYGGFHYYCYQPYYYHPYTPYYYGPFYNPWGFFVTTIAITAIVVTAQNQQYYYDSGVYYVRSDGGYTVVEAPAGVTVKALPKEAQTVVVNETTNNYYYGGTYYEKSGDEYIVVPPTAGTVVEHLPKGGEEVKIGEVTYVQVGKTYYQPIKKDGKEMYEVVNVEKADEDKEK
jgi:hypothetical protein